LRAPQAFIFSLFILIKYARLATALWKKKTLYPLEKLIKATLQSAWRQAKEKDFLLVFG